MSESYELMIWTLVLSFSSTSPFQTPRPFHSPQSLIAEMRKIEQRKKDREKRAGDIQKLLSKAADVSGVTGGAIRGGASSSSLKAGSAHGNDSPGGGDSGDGRRGPDGKKVSELRMKINSFCYTLSTFGQLFVSRRWNAAKS